VSAPLSSGVGPPFALKAEYSEIESNPLGAAPGAPLLGLLAKGRVLGGWPGLLRTKQTGVLILRVLAKGVWDRQHILYALRNAYLVLF